MIQLANKVEKFSFEKHMLSLHRGGDKYAGTNRGGTSYAGLYGGIALKTSTQSS